jgi:hypothetical protein
MIELPAFHFRCEGRTVRVMGERTLAIECVRCARRTADRPDGVMFLQPPVSGPCMSRLDEEDAQEACL